MKVVIWLFSVCILHPSLPGLLLLDTSYRTAPTSTDDFTWDMYTNKLFPIYADDKKDIIDAANRLAKLIDNNPACNTWDTIRVNNSRFIISVRCDDYKTYTVRFQTKILDKNLSCNIELTNKEIDPRKAQRKLIDFATYLESKK